MKHDDYRQALAFFGRIRLGEQEQKSGIDFVVGKPRTQAVMLIEGVYEDGSAAQDFGANVEDVASIQRAFADPKSGSEGVLRVELWAGETYRIRTWHHDVHSARMEGNAVRVAIDEWKGEGGPSALVSRAPESVSSCGGCRSDSSIALLYRWH